MKTTFRSGRRAAVAGLLALTLVAAACGDDDDSSADTAASADSEAPAGTDAPAATEAPAGTEAPDATEAPSGTEAPAATTGGGDAEDFDRSAYDLDAVMNVTNDGNPANLDPHQEPTQGSTPYWLPLYDTITDISVSGEVNPRLAESWEYSDDGQNLVFTLREDVSFHDGTPMNAEAVKASLDRARTDEKSTQKNVLASITDVQATGPYEVTLTLTGFDRSLPWVLGTAAGAVVNPAALAAATDLTTTSDGTAPYVVTAFEPDVKVEYERAEGEPWDPRSGLLAGFTINHLTDYQVALNGLQAGQYDMIRLNGLGSAVEQATSGGDLVETELPSLQTLSFWLNNQDPVWQDVRVRQAFQYALDREGIANAVFDGGSECAAASQVAPFEGDQMFIEGYDPYPYDPEKAQQLLEEAGATGTAITITDIGATNTTNLMQAAQPMLEAVGFDVELVIGTAAETAPGFQQFRIQTAVIPNAKQAHPDIFLKRYWLTDGPYHLAQGEDQEIVAAMGGIADPAVSDEEAQATYQEIASSLAEDIATLVVACDVVWSMVHGDHVVGVDPRTFFLNMRVVGVEND